MRKFALIGKNIAYSFSPDLHNAFFRSVSLNAQYALEDFNNKEFNAASWNDLISIYDGFNVTIPFKEAVIPYLDQLDEVSRAVGAVNTVLVKEGKTIGYNTDYNGFLSLYDSIIHKTPKTAYILGTGGAAKVVDFALRNKGVENIYFVTRQASLEGATTLSYEAFRSQKKTNALLVNATPIGSKQYENQCPISEEHLVGFDGVIDLIYTPSETLLLQMAKKRGILGVNGYKMLMVQAYEAEKIWWKDLNIEKNFFVNYQLK